MKKFLELFKRKKYISLGIESLGFFSDSQHYMDVFGLYALEFSSIPSLITEEKIDVKKARLWLVKNYSQLIIDEYSDGKCVNELGEISFINCFIILKSKVIIHFNFKDSKVVFAYKEKLRGLNLDVIKGVSSFEKIIKPKGKIYLLTKDETGLRIKGFNLIPPKFPIEDNYNDDFYDFHKTIFDRLQLENDKGLVLLHGKPGTGKSSYIKYLSSKLSKRTLFLPTHLASQISSPELINLLIDNPNSILVIEDAEDIILERGVNSFSAVSTLLNLTDGLLSDVLSVHVICTFNTNVSKIDQALLRKGRLIASYEFKKLNIEKAQKLSAKLNFKNEITEPMFLNEIYNQDEETYTIDNDSRPVGFSLVN